MFHYLFLPFLFKETLSINNRDLKSGLKDLSKLHEEACVLLKLEKKKNVILIILNY